MNSSVWRASRAIPAAGPPPMRNASGRLPTSSVHWFTFEERRVPKAASSWPRRASTAATRSSGDSEARGASHWTSRNSSMPRTLPPWTSAPANGSAATRMTNPATAKSATTVARRARRGRSPTCFATPTRTGSARSPCAARHKYARNSGSRTAASYQASRRVKGITRQYTLAAARKASSIRLPSCRRTPRGGSPRLRSPQANSSATNGQPRPSSSRLLPVMFAAAYWAFWGMCPALQAKYRSTAYSGRTAITARIAVARFPEMSWRAASAAQTSRNAEATTAAPKTAMATGAARCAPESRKTTAGAAIDRASAIFHQFDIPSSACWPDAAVAANDAPARMVPGSEGLVRPALQGGGPGRSRYVDLPDAARAA